MKIALPSRNNQIDNHFGHCEYYTIFTVDGNKQIVAEETQASPVGCGCKSNIATFLAQKGVTHMLAGNMGEGAVGVLKANGIQVTRGCHGPVRAVAEAWLAGKIQDSGTSCSDHGECGH